MTSGRNFITQDLNGHPLRWRDHKGIVHAVELAPPRAEGDVDAWWTRCGGWNISRSEAWGGAEELSCPSCSAIERGI